MKQKRKCVISEKQLEKLLIKFKGYWDYILKYYDIPERLLEKYLEELDIYHLVGYQTLSEDFIHKHLSKNFDWDCICRHQTLSEEFILSHMSYIDWETLLLCNKFDESFLELLLEKSNDGLLETGTYSIDLWYHYAMTQDLSESFMEKYWSKLDKSCIVYHQKLSVPFIEKHLKDLDFVSICQYQKLSDDFIEKYFDKIVWSKASYNISEQLILDHPEILDNVYWGGVSSSPNLSESFIEKYKDKVDWQNISLHQKLSESFIIKHELDVDWCYIIRKHKLSEEFIERVISMGIISNLNDVIRYQVVSENFIENHKSEVNWSRVSRYQTLSDSFMEKHIEDLNMDNISIYQNLSDEFITKFLEKLSEDNIPELLTYQDLSFSTIVKLLSLL